MTKNIICIILAIIFLTGCVSSTKQYEKVSSLTQKEKDAYSCADIDADIQKLNNLLKEIGDVPTSDKVMANVGIAAAVLRASLGGFNSSDFQLRADVKEQTDAIERANERLKQLKEFKEEKRCKNNI